MSKTVTNSDDALQIWREKLADFERELAICADAPGRFELRKRIEECNREIARLEAESEAPAKTPPEPARADTRPWNVPYSKNPFFTGREKVLADVEKELHASGLVALSGLPGVGKTQTAVEYAYRRRKDYKSAFWAKAESRDALVSDFAAIATLLSLPEGVAKEQEVAVSAFKRWLENNTEWLLVLDNADDLGMTREFIPPDSNGHILLTTRAQAVGAVAERVEIEEMDQAEGALFLLRRAGVIAKDAQLDAANQADRKLAKQISQELGGLPLALDQAGAFIEETPSSLAEYIEFYKTEGAKVRAQRGGLGEHPSVTVTFSLAFKKVAEKSAAGADLIRLCAFLAPDAIPEEMFTESAAELGENLGQVARSKLDFAQVLKEAGRFSLIDRDPRNRTLDIHRLVQVVVKDGMPKTDQWTWAERAVQAVNRAFPSVEFANWAQCERLVHQALACASLIEAYGFEFEEAGRLLNDAGYYLHHRARFSDAEPLYQRALKICGKALGPEHPHVATSLNNLAELYRAQGKYAQAEPLYQGALAICEKVLGSDHPDVATSLNNLALLYNNQGKYAQAEPLYQRALAIREKVLGSGHPAVATSLNNLAGLYHEQGRYAEAEPLYQRALAIREKALGPDHPDVATSFNNLAELYRAQRKYAEAEPLHQRALAIREKALGPDHPNAAQSLNNLASLYSALGKHARADPLYQRSLTILEKALGLEHPDVGTSLNKLALLYSRQGRYAEAEPLFQRALNVYEKALGPDHPHVATSLNNLALLYSRQGKYAEAEALYQRALAIREKVLGPEHPDVAMVLENYAGLLREMKRGAAARELEARAQAIRAAHAKNNPSK